LWNKKAAADKYYKKFNFPITPHFANTILSVVALFGRFVER
jgi:hypothetical protein